MNDLWGAVLALRRSKGANLSYLDFFETLLFFRKDSDDTIIINNETTKISITSANDWIITRNLIGLSLMLSTGSNTD